MNKRLRARLFVQCFIQRRLPLVPCYLNDLFKPMQVAFIPYPAFMLDRSIDESLPSKVSPIFAHHTVG